MFFGRTSELLEVRRISTPRSSSLLTAIATVNTREIFRLDQLPRISRTPLLRLYAFTTATFTPGGQTGRDGPALSTARSGLTGTGTDTWKNNTAFFNTINGIQLWTVPQTGNYRIEAWGAQGGTSGGQRGGFGARIRGDFALTEGEIIRIVVGQQGSTGAHTQDGQSISAGGGGTYVVRTPFDTTGSILVIAGGGGGAAQNTWNSIIGQDANISNNGGQGGSGSGGGTGGGGGASSTGTGGAGFSGNGATGSGSSASEMAQAFINGSRGGGNARSWGGSEIYGGFGGGAGGGGLAAGGGGGYSGGAAGVWSSQQQGGGGASFNNGGNQSNNNGNESTAQLAGNGQVQITLI